MKTKKYTPERVEEMAKQSTYPTFKRALQDAIRFELTTFNENGFIKRDRLNFDAVSAEEYEANKAIIQKLVDCGLIFTPYVPIITSRKGGLEVHHPTPNAIELTEVDGGGLGTVEILQAIIERQLED